MLAAFIAVHIASRPVDCVGGDSMILMMKNRLKIVNVEQVALK